MSDTKLPMANRMLWCVHVYGPDTVIAQPDFETAVKRAQEQQTYIDRVYWAMPASESDLIMFAWAEPWPHSAESHAADLAKHGGNPEDWC